MRRDEEYHMTIYEPWRELSATSWLHHMAGRRNLSRYTHQLCSINRNYSCPLYPLGRGMGLCKDGYHVSSVWQKLCSAIYLTGLSYSTSGPGT